MKKILKIQLLLLSVAGMFAACSSSDDNGKADDNGKIDVVQNIEFKVNFKDYNAEKEVSGTRAAKQTPDTLSRQTVDLGNGLLAEVTVQRDTAKTATPAGTRALDNGTYTMLAYQGPQIWSYSLKAKVTGTLKDGKFTPHTAMHLNPGEYLFVLHNGLLEEATLPMGTPGLKLTRANVENALIGVTRYTVTAAPDPQFVDFAMEHAASRLRIKLTGWMPIENGTTASLDVFNENLIPTEVVYEIPGFDPFNYGKFNESTSLTFPASNTLNANGTYTSTSNEYLYVMPGTDMQGFQLRLTGGQMYKLPLNGVKVRLISLVDPAAHLAAVISNNESYLVNINLKYNFLYLMSDGSTDFLNSTQYTALREADGTTKRYVDKHGVGLATPKIPVAVVLSQSNHMAMALRDHSAASMQWAAGYNVNTNSHSVTNMVDALNTNITSGYDETYDPSYNTTNYITSNIPKSQHGGFIAPRYAANYFVTGVTFASSLKWYLPSYSDWKWAYSALGLGDKSTITEAYKDYSWNENLVKLAFTQAGGYLSTTNNSYWTSSEEANPGVTYAGTVILNNGTIRWDRKGKDDRALCRPFVRY